MEEVIKKIEQEIEKVKTQVENLKGVNEIITYGTQCVFEGVARGLQRAIEIIRENKEDK